MSDLALSPVEALPVWKEFALLASAALGNAHLANEARERLESLDRAATFIAAVKAALR